MAGRFFLSEDGGVNRFGALEEVGAGGDAKGIVIGGRAPLVRRTPVLPSTMPNWVAARMKYCIVVPVLRVLFAFNAVRVSFRF